MWIVLLPTTFCLAALILIQNLGIHQCIIFYSFDNNDADNISDLHEAFDHQLTTNASDDLETALNDVVEESESCTFAPIIPTAICLTFILETTRVSILSMRKYLKLSANKSVRPAVIAENLGNMHTL